MQGKNVDRFPLNVGMTPDLNDELNDRTKGVDSCSAQINEQNTGRKLVRSRSSVVINTR